MQKKSTDTRVNPEVRNFWRQIKAKIRGNRNTLLVEMAVDPDWLRFCDTFDTYIEERIRNAWSVMIHKSNSTTVHSDRYGGGRTINPFDQATLAYETILGMAKVFGKDILELGASVEAVALLHLELIP